MCPLTSLERAVGASVTWEVESQSRIFTHLPWIGGSIKIYYFTRKYNSRKVKAEEEGQDLITK